MLNAIHKALHTKLTASSALTSLLSGAGAVYFQQAPLDAVLPYVVYILAGGGEINDSPLANGDLMYYVKGVAETALAAGNIADSIRSALHEQAMTIDSPWTVYRCQMTQTLMFAENVERRQFWHAGGSYRIRISQ
jgi:hypothetical protein